MDAALEVAVAGEHRRDDEVVVLHRARDGIGQRAAVPDAVVDAIAARDEGVELVRPRGRRPRARPRAAIDDAVARTSATSSRVLLDAVALGVVRFAYRVAIRRTTAVRRAARAARPATGNRNSHGGADGTCDPPACGRRREPIVALRAASSAGTRRLRCASSSDAASSPGALRTTARDDRACSCVHARRHPQALMVNPAKRSPVDRRRARTQRFVARSSGTRRVRTNDKPSGNASRTSTRGTPSCALGYDEAERRTGYS